MGVALYLLKTSKTKSLLLKVREQPLLHLFVENKQD